MDEATGTISFQEESHLRRSRSTSIEESVIGWIYFAVISVRVGKSNSLFVD